VAIAAGHKIVKVPTKILNALTLQDNFYLNLIDWSSWNPVTMGLGSFV
jgi:hypothetical protein